MPSGRSEHYGDEYRPIDTRPLTELPDVQELSLEELADLPDQTRHFILMRAARQFRQEQEELESRRT